MRIYGAKTDNRDGLALVVTLLVIMMIGALAAAAVKGAMAVIRSENATYRSDRAFYVAEAGAEAALSQVEVALSDGVITDAELAAMQPPAIEGYDFVDFLVERDDTAIVERITDGPWSGMYSLTQNLIITSRATDAAGAHSAVLLGAKAQAIPIFQFAEFSPEGTQSLAGDADTRGRFHSNGDMFLYSTGPGNRFHGVVTTAGRIHRDRMRMHVDPSAARIFIADASTALVKLTFDSDDTPDPESFKARSTADFDGRLQTEAFGVDSLKLPLPDGVAFRELVRPKEVGDTDTEKETKLAWKADMYVTIDLGDVRDRSVVCGMQPPAGLATKLPTITVDRPYGGAVPGDSIKCEIFHWKWEAFYDSGDEHFIDVVDIDVAELGNWVGLDPANNAPEIIYVEFKDAAAVTDPSVTDPSDAGYYWPALKFVNGSQLPGPLTMGSEYPFYIQGDYNTGLWEPASIFGDRLTLLSNQWVDGVIMAPITRRRDAPDALGNTVLNVALITGEGEGHVGCFHEDAGCTPDTDDPAWIVKRLEDWKNCPAETGDRCLCVFNGSFISAWAPQISKDHDVPPSYKYTDVCALRRNFDLRFLDPSNLPPGTPVVGNVFRASFREAY
jgi:hypothetical protein